MQPIAQLHQFPRLGSEGAHLFLHLAVVTGAAKSGTFTQRRPNLRSGIRVHTQSNGLQAIASNTITRNQVRPALPNATPQQFSFMMASRRLMGIVSVL
jgi:hypothetical protein